MDRMTIALNVYNAWKEHTTRSAGNIESEKRYFTSDTWKIAQEVIELRKHG